MPVVIDFFKYIMLIAAAFVVGTKIYYVSFLGAVLLIDMFTSRIAMSVKPLYALLILIATVIFVILT